MKLQSDVFGLKTYITNDKWTDMAHDANEIMCYMTNDKFPYGWFGIPVFISLSLSRSHYFHDP